MASFRKLALRATDLLAACAAPVAALTASRPGRIPVLCYHRVLPGFVEGSVPAYSVRPEQFEAQLAYLRVHDYRALTLAEYEAVACGSAPVQARSVLITFDDGFADNLAVAAPIAARYGMALNLFVCTGLIEGVSQPIRLSGDPAIVEHRTRQPRLWAALTWDELRKMRDAGHGLGFHSHHHADFGELSQREMEEDAYAGLSLFVRELGFRPTAFAFPYGTERSCPPAACSLLAEQGTRILFSTRLAVSRLPVRQPTLPRIMVYEQDTLAVFARKLVGAYDWLGSARALYQRQKMARAHAHTARVAN
jgi:peptidoglycan/xylan/chitin deacetylase (PgdA/CDA1 family)